MIYIKKFRLFFFYFISALLLSCTGGPRLFRVDYVQWVKNNGRTQLGRVVRIDDITYTLRYVPSELRYVMSKEEVKKEDLARRDVYMEFQLSISIVTGEETLRYATSESMDYFKRIRYYSYDAAGDFCLIEGKDKMHALDVQINRSFGAMPELQLGVIFRSPDKMRNNNIAVSYYDRIYKDSLIIFHFDKKMLQAIPRLKI